MLLLPPGITNVIWGQRQNSILKWGEACRGWGLGPAHTGSGRKGQGTERPDVTWARPPRRCCLHLLFSREKEMHRFWTRSEGRSSTQARRRGRDHCWEQETEPRRGFRGCDSDLRGVWKYQKTFLVVTAGEEGAPDISGAEARDAPKHPLVY